MNCVFALFFSLSCNIGRPFLVRFADLERTVMDGSSSSNDSLSLGPGKPYDGGFVDVEYFVVETEVRIDTGLEVSVVPVVDNNN